MNSAKLNDWMQVFGIFALVGSLIFIGLQMKQEREIAIYEGLGVAGERVRGFRTLIADNAGVWRRGCLAEELSDDERSRFASIYATYYYYALTNWRRLQSVDYAAFTVGSMSNFTIRRYALNHHRYPGLRQTRESLLAWQELEEKSGESSSSHFNAIYEKEMAYLEVKDPNPEYDVIWCGR